MNDKRKRLVLRCWVCGENSEVFEEDVFVKEASNIYYVNCKHCGQTLRVMLKDTKRIFGKITPKVNVVSNNFLQC